MSAKVINLQDYRLQRLQADLSGEKALQELQSFLESLSEPIAPKRPIRRKSSRRDPSK